MCMTVQSEQHSELKLAGIESSRHARAMSAQQQLKLGMWQDAGSSGHLPHLLRPLLPLSPVCQLDSDAIAQVSNRDGGVRLVLIQQVHPLRHKHCVCGIDSRGEGVKYMQSCGWLNQRSMGQLSACACEASMMLSSATRQAGVTTTHPRRCKCPLFGTPASRSCSSTPRSHPLPPPAPWSLSAPVVTAARFRKRAQVRASHPVPQPLLPLTAPYQAAFDLLLSRVLH